MPQTDLVDLASCSTQLSGLSLESHGKLQRLELAQGMVLGSCLKLPLKNLNHQTEQMDLRLYSASEMSLFLHLAESEGGSDASTDPAIVQRELNVRIELREQAKLNLCMLQELSESTPFQCRIEVVQGAQSQFRFLEVGCGAGRSQRQTEVHTLGSGTNTELFNLSLASGEQQVQLHSSIDHQARQGTSLQLCKGVLSQRARLRFQGRIAMASEALFSEARQTNHNLLLSKSAQVESQPQLEIQADDVKATHGATSGQISEDELFYLQSRGIERARAQLLVLRAFVYELPERFSAPSLAPLLSQAIDRRLIGICNAL